MKFDVAIIGASSSGLFAAELLARAGQRVAVFERQPELAPERRTLIITPHLWKVLGDFPQEAILHYTRLMSVEANGRNVTIELRDPDLIIERSLLAQLLVARAQEAGAELHYGYRFTRLRPAPDGVLLSFAGPDGTSRSATARTVIGADGVTSTVASAAGLPHPPAVPIVQAEVRLPAGWNPTMTHVWFDVEDTRFFYWLIPESEQHAVVGLVGDGRDGTRYLLDRFLARQNLQPLKYQAARIALYHPRLRVETRVGTAPLLLVGDAAGQVKVTTVGGTVTGFWGARAAVNSLLSGTSYRAEQRALNNELNLHWGLRVLLERLNNKGYGQLVSYITHPVQQFLSRYNRDDMVVNIWQMAFLQPRFVPLAMKLLVKRNGHAPSPSVLSVPESVSGTSTTQA